MMDANQKMHVAKLVDEAYRRDMPQWAAYLELCLRTEEMPDAASMRLPPPERRVLGRFPERAVVK